MVGYERRNGNDKEKREFSEKNDRIMLKLNSVDFKELFLMNIFLAKS